MNAPSLVPLGARARWAVALLALTIVIDVIAIGFDAWDIALIDGYLDGEGTSAAALESSDDRQVFIGAIEFAVLVATAIVFIRWFHAAYRNTATLAASELQFKPGWAIGSWFVPILNLWRPRQIANEIWSASDLETPAVDGSLSRPTETTGLLTLWWVVWLISGFVGNITGRILFNADTLEDIRDSDKLDIAALAVGIAAAVLAILVVQRTTSRQLEWAQHLGPADGDALISPH